MGDTPVSELGGRTPLEAARTPAMDRLAARGKALLVKTVPPGFPPGSDVANMSLLGYEPEKYYTGRAPLEAASMGVVLGPDDLAFRCNLVTLAGDPGNGLRMLDYSAGHISTAEAHQLLAALQDRCGTDRLTLYGGVSYRHLLVYRGNAEGLVTVPPHDHTDQDVTTFYNRYRQVDDLYQLLACSREVLASHPVNSVRRAQGRREANSIWLWGEGVSPAMESMQSRYHMTGSLVSAVDLLKGLGVCLGLAVKEVDGATGNLDTNYQGKVAAAVESLGQGDLVVVHVEAPDEAGHQGDAAAKVQAIEDFDQQIVAPLIAALEAAGESFRLAVTMDHYTPLDRRTHTDWPVPVVLYDSRRPLEPTADGFNEKALQAAVDNASGTVVSGPVFFSLLVEYTGR